jgi:hypothetical protein
MTFMRSWKSHRLTSHTWLGLNPQIGRPLSRTVVPLVFFFFFFLIFKIDAIYANFRSLVKNNLNIWRFWRSSETGVEKVSSVWKFFGSLHFRTKKVNKDKSVCIPCLDVQNLILKA